MFITLFLPILAYILLKVQKSKITEGAFKIKYLTLYSSLSIKREQVIHLMTPLFCFRRIFVAYTTVMWTNFAYISIYN